MRAHPHPRRRLVSALVLTCVALVVVAGGAAAAGASPAETPAISVSGSPQTSSPATLPAPGAPAGARGGAPTTTVSLDPEPGPSGWIGTSPVDMHVYVGDTGTGYGGTRASVDGGVTWTFADPGEWFTITGAGVIECLYQSVDLYDVWEPVQTKVIKIDDQSPVPDAKTYKRSRYGTRSKLRFTVADECPTVRVRVITKTARGKVVNTSKWYRLNTNVTNTYFTWFPHPRGTYKWYVVAVDPLGRQGTDWNYLVVY